MTMSQHSSGLQQAHGRGRFTGFTIVVVQNKNSFKEMVFSTFHTHARFRCRFYVAFVSPGDDSARQTLLNLLQFRAEVAKCLVFYRKTNGKKRSDRPRRDIEVQLEAKRHKGPAAKVPVSIPLDIGLK